MAEDSLEDILVRWEELSSQGRSVSAEELCRDRPDLTDEVRRRIRVLEKVYRLRGADANAPTLGPSDLVGLPRKTELPHVAGFEVLEEVGRGGMGVVYKARQLGLNRLVALKMILSGAHAGDAELSRFRAEAEAVARLQHPNIVQIFEVGEQDGRPFLCLEFVDGVGLDKALKGKPQPAEDAARLTRTLAEAVQYAHERGVVHRDLKPANVLLAGPSQTAKISDFGLAKRLDEVGQTQTGAVLGTPNYMAPEQAEGKTHAVGPAADVYSLGAILYELLTGRPPFQGATLIETLDQVRSHDPVPPRLLQPAVPRDLEAICLKCLHKEPERRYGSARALAEDLTRFLQGETIHARSGHALEYVTRLINRNPDVSPFGDLRAPWLVYLAPLPFLVQLAFYLAAGDQPYYPLASIGVTALGLAAVLALAVLIREERNLGLPSGVSRQLWSTRIGHLFGLLIMLWLSYLITPADRPWDPRTVYPLWAAVAGLTFFNLGGWFWGRLYLLGLAAFTTAVLMAWRLDLAPVILGLMVSTGLAVLGWQLRVLSRAATSKQG